MTCGGIFADVQWLEVLKDEPVKQGVELDGEVGVKLAKMFNDLKKELMKGKGGDELEKKKYMKLVTEYKKFKKSNVQHFRFSSTSTKTAFGQFYSRPFATAALMSRCFGEEIGSTLQLVVIYFDTATFDDIERDKKVKIEAQLSLIRGSMGLLTGFSIISGIEIIFLFLRSRWLS